MVWLFMILLFFVVVVVDVILDEKLEKKTERIYICSEGHTFTEPDYMQVSDYEGFTEEIKVCPHCKSGFHNTKEELTHEEKKTI